MSCYVVASSRSWFSDLPKSDEYGELDIHEVTAREHLTEEYLATLKPRYVFFPHWNWLVPEAIFANYECVVFHTAPLPYGRGGSPIQNLIIRGHESAPVCALQMTEALDGGPIYLSEEVSLGGSLEEILGRIGAVVERQILQICREEPEPKDQDGEPYIFSRLSPADGELSEVYSLQELYDRIRMVDADGYPKAYIQFGKHKIEFSGAKLENGELTANLRIFADED